MVVFDRRIKRIKEWPRGCWNTPEPGPQEGWHASCGHSKDTPNDRDDDTVGWREVARRGRKALCCLVRLSIFLMLSNKQRQAHRGACASGTMLAPLEPLDVGTARRMALRHYDNATALRRSPSHRSRARLAHRAG